VDYLTIVGHKVWPRSRGPATVCPLGRLCWGAGETVGAPPSLAAPWWPKFSCRAMLWRLGDRAPASQRDLLGRGQLWSCLWMWGGQRSAPEGTRIWAGVQERGAWQCVPRVTAAVCPRSSTARGSARCTCVVPGPPPRCTPCSSEGDRRGVSGRGKGAGWWPGERGLGLAAKPRLAAAWGGQPGVGRWIRAWALQALLREEPQGGSAPFPTTTERGPGPPASSAGSCVGNVCALRLGLWSREMVIPCSLFRSSTENTPMIAGLGQVSHPQWSWVSCALGTLLGGASMEMATCTPWSLEVTNLGCRGAGDLQGKETGVSGAGQRTCFGARAAGFAALAAGSRAARVAQGTEGLLVDAGDLAVAEAVPRPDSRAGGCERSLTGLSLLRLHSW